MPSILHRYIQNEMWPTFFSSLLVGVFIIIASKMLPITEMIVSRGVGLGQVSWMIVYLLPDILIFSLPAASLMASVVAFLRLSADSEIIAMKASGISLHQMLPPVVILCTLGLIFSLAITVIAVPWGNRSFKELLFQIAQSKADLGIKANVFSEPFPNVVFYVNRFSPQEGVMEEVFVVDRRDRKVTNTIVAKEARVYNDAERHVISLRFAKGTMFVVGRDLGAARTIEFETYELNVGLEDIMTALASREKSPKELTVTELLKGLGKAAKGEVRYNEMLMELMEKITIPIAVFFMGLVGFPLGAQIQARGRSVGIGVGLVVFVIYYLCLAGVRSISENAALPPLLAAWIPDIFLIVAFFYLYSRVASERPLRLIPSIFTKAGTSDEGGGA